MYKPRSEYWDWFLREEDGKYLLGDNNSRPEIFCRYVDVVNIETSAYCNRKCSYCPLSQIERQQEYISDELLEKIVCELAAVGYANRIALNLYNEPLYDEKLLERIKKIKSNLPECYLQFNSNGDALTVKKLSELRSAGLNQILVTLHTPADKEYEDVDRLNAVEKFLRKLGLEHYGKNIKMESGRNITLDIKEKEWRFLICCNNWGDYGNDRGGIVQKLSVYGRKRPCVNPFREICISYDGFFKPCCNIYFGEGSSFGNINSESIVDCYFSREMTAFRRGCFVFGKKNHWCNTCNTEDNASVNSIEYRQKILHDCMEIV